MPHLEAPSIVPLEDCPIMSGGMGAHVLSPEGLGRISAMGAAATASVTAAEVVVARELMRGNEAFFRALGQFPVQYMAEQFADSYWRGNHSAVSCVMVVTGVVVWCGVVA